MTAASVNVRRGFWTNYEASIFNKYRFLCSEVAANVWTNAMAIAMALVLARLVIILLKAIDLTLPGAGTQAHPQQNPAIPLPARHQPPQPLVGQNQPIPHHWFSEVRSVVDDTHSSIGGVLRIVKRVWRTITFRPVTLRDPNRSIMTRLKDLCSDYQRNIQRESRLIAVLFLVLTACLGLFLLECFGSVFSSYFIVIDSLAISQAPGCGIYKPPLEGPLINNASRNVDQETETDSGDYARTCYDEPDGADGCNFFATQKIAFKEYHDQPCPFGRDVCPEDGSKAFKLETDSFSATKLGINTEEVYRIKRTVICTPLNMNESFIRRRVVNGHNMTAYYYGEYSDSNGHSPYTWDAPATHMSTQYAGYSVSAFLGFRHDGSNGWTPLPALAPPEHHKVLLLLIGSHNVNHLSPRNDPVFPTNLNKTFHWSGESIPVFTDATDIAKPLACLESTLMCVPNSSYCQSPPFGQPGQPSYRPGFSPRSPEGQAALYLTQIIVISSNMFTSIRARLASGLIATSKISQAMSLPLAPEQWKAESRRLFQTSLAGFQILARDISRARWAGETGLRNVFDQNPPDVVSQLCSLYKFNASGWKNINVVGSSITLGILLLILLVSFEVEDKIHLFVPIGRFFRRCGKFVTLTAWPRCVVAAEHFGDKILRRGQLIVAWIRS